MRCVAGLAGRVVEAASPPDDDCSYECVECLETSETVRTSCPHCGSLVVRVVEPRPPPR